MARRDIIVIGASLGGVDALPRLVGSLPPDLGAAVFVVLHIPPNSPDLLAARLNSVGPLPAVSAVDGQVIVPNRIYVAVSDRHLMIEGDQIRLSLGPRESHARPSIDVLFRSAAYYCGSRVIGIVLTGTLDDGTAGLWAIKDRGGMAIVQSPEEAAYPSMPRSALRHVNVDYTLKLAEIADVLRVLTASETHEEGRRMPHEKLEIETRIALEDNALEIGVRALGTASFYTCPDCSGTMIAIQDGSFLRFRCHTGHAHTANSLAEHALPKIEGTLWSALAQLEEREVLFQELERRARDDSSLNLAADYAREASETRRLLLRVREVVLDPVLSRGKREVRT